MLSSGQSHSSYVPDHWSGRVWGRTGCHNTGGVFRCQTGDCGPHVQCNGAGGAPPATLAEITFDASGGQDFYDLSLVDGYNLQMSMQPVAGTFQAGGGHYYCSWAGCNRDLNSNCPNELRLNGDGGVVGCKSACLRFNTDSYCCRGAHGTPQTCPAFSYSRLFKSFCPEAYSYAYDDHKSTFTCRNNGGTRTEYNINFC